MPKPVVNFKKVTKSYGKSRGIANVSLEVMPGEVFGFLGPNGAGKTTSISLMMDLIRPTSGSIKIFDLDSMADSLKIRRRIGFLMDDMALDKGLTGWQQLEYFGRLRGDFNQDRVRQLAKRLNCKLNVKFKNLSRGNRQKVGLISALMHDPELLILDEPTSGLDPLIQAEFNKIILEHKAKGKTTFISSHILTEVQELCDRAAFIKDGEIIATKSLSEIGKDSPSKVNILSVDKSLVSAIKKLSGVHDLRHNDTGLSFTYSGDSNKLVTVLNKAKIDHLTIQDADLETIFMKYYEAKHAK